MQVGKDLEARNKEQKKKKKVENKKNKENAIHYIHASNAVPEEQLDELPNETPMRAK